MAAIDYVRDMVGSDGNTEAITAWNAILFDKLVTDHVLRESRDRATQHSQGVEAGRKLNRANCHACGGPHSMRTHVGAAS